MTQKEYVQLLAENISDLKDALRWLNRSFDICSKIGISDSYTDDEYDAYEALGSRFARVCDMLLQKSFRTIDAMEMESGGTLIDAVNRAEKRGIIDSSNNLRELRELRNEIAHEYKIEMHRLFASILSLTPRLIAYVEKTIEYSGRYTAGVEKS
jgi:uncharacterized protein YutE (UPF0331/DUF86 family)